jgi:hypothetical protein
MDFVERWLGFSPDGGSGAYEVVLIGVLLAALAAMMRCRLHGVRRRR